MTDDPLGLDDPLHLDDPLGLDKNKPGMIAKTIGREGAISNAVSGMDPYDEYLKTYKKRWNKPQIPGTQVPQLMSREEYDSARTSELQKAPVGGVEAGLNLAGGLGGMLIAPVVAGMHSLDQLIKGQPTDSQRAYEAALGHAGSLGTQLANATGLQSNVGDVLNAGIGEAVNQVGFPSMGIHGFPSINTGLKKAMPELSAWPNLQSENIPARPSVADVIAKHKADDPLGLDTPENAFWKQRAENMTAEDRTANRLQAAIDKQNPAQDTVFVGQEGNAIPGDQGRGMLESTRDVQYEQVPPDAVIPRDAMFDKYGQPALKVPRGNNWPVDANGMPVRNGIAEPGIEPPYVGRYMPQNEAARNDLGNAIQDANGPRLGVQDTYGSEPLGGPMGAPDPYKGMGSGQRGAVNIQAIIDALKGVRDKQSNVTDLPPPTIPVGDATEIFNHADMPKPNLGIVPKGQRGVLNIKAIEDGFDNIRKKIAKLNPADRQVRAKVVTEHLNKVSDEISEVAPEVSRILRRKDVSEIADHIVESQNLKDPSQYWQEMLAGVTKAEDPTIGGQMKQWGKIWVGQAKGPKDILKLELSDAAKIEANTLAQAINTLYKEFIAQRGLPESPEQPNADGLSVYHDKRMENADYAKRYGQFEEDIRRYNSDVDASYKEFEKKYGISPSHFDEMSLEHSTPEDHVWSLIFNVANSEAHSWHNKINASNMLTKQRGGIDINSVVDGVKMAGEGVRRMFTGETPPKVDTILSPRSAENIAAKEAKAEKARAIDLTNSPYEKVNTIEDALSNPGPDISSNAVRNSLTPGVQSMVRHTTRNKLLKFARDVVYSARNKTEEFSKTFVTDKENGMSSALKDATPEEQMRVHQILEETSKQKVDLTPEMIAQLELSPREAKLLETTRAMLDGMYTLANEAYTKQGFSPLKKHPGYSPDMFSGAYTTILRVPKTAGEKSGQVLVAQADTKYGMNKAVEYYKKNFPDHTEIVELPRRGLQETAQRTNRVFDGFQKLISVVAENNPDFAEMKKLADDYAANNIKQMYQFQVHQKMKTGARGSLGDRPWLDAKENAQQFWKGVIDYAEEGSRYYSYQDALNELGKMQTNPELQTSHPNTLAYLQKYSDNLQGKGLNLAGALGNAMVDLAPKLVGVSPKAVSVPLSIIRRASSIVMMGGVNLGFMAMQMTQLATGGMPEMVKIGTTLGLSPKDITGVFTTLNTSLAGLVLEGKNNKASFVPEHMRNGWEWAKQHGIFDLNETVLAGEALKPGFWRNAEKVATFPMWASEKLTRPPVFMLFTDMFHRAGFEQEKAFRMAQEATDYSMANYHPDERAMLYSSLGTLGNQMSALTVFKHNLLDQWYTRTADVKKGEIAPALTMIGMGYALYGMSGMPGYQEADQLTQWATGKTIRDVMGDALGAGSKVMDGVLSATTGLDFSSKLSMASILPDDKLSAFPHISNIAKILGAAVDYASRLDKASGEQLAYQLTPSGMRGMLEQPMRNDDKSIPERPLKPGEGFVLDKHGNHKYEVPRTDAEWKWRQAMGVRPLHERVSDEQDWAHEKEWKRKEQKQKDAGNNLQDAIKLRDKESVMKYVKEYVDAGGDPSTFSDAWFQNVLVQSNLSQHQRLQGIPANNLKSINRYNAIP
jgi:hypothetical protein